MASLLVEPPSGVLFIFYADISPVSTQKYKGTLSLINSTQRKGGAMTMMKWFVELETPEKATPTDTMLLYALAEELVLTKKWCERYSRISTDIVRVEITAGDDQKDALCRMYNALRCSKNYMAHICAVTIIDVSICK